RARLGRSFQDARLFPSLTVGEALAVALERHMRAHDAVSTAIGAPWVRRAEKKVAARVDELVELMGLGAFRDKFVSELSTGSRRIVDLAAILAHEPLVLLLDEPSSGIAQRETEALGPLLQHIRQQTGASLLVIEHDMPLITSISDEILALETGAVLTRGKPDEVLSDPRLVAAYLGTDQAVLERSGMRTDQKPVRAAAKRPPVGKKKAAAKKPAAAALAATSTVCAVAGPIRVILAEDNYLVREGVRRLIETEGELELAAVCEDYDGLIAAVEAEKPDVVLTDIRMPPTGTDEGIRAAEEIRESHPEVGVVVLSQYVDPAYALHLFEHGSERR